MVICDRRAGGAALIVAAVAASIAMIQQAPPDSRPSDSKSSSKKNLVVLGGCVDGSMLKNAEPKENVVIVPGIVRTTGSRAIRSTLKELNGHTVELTGTLKGMDNVAQGALVKDTGKTKIYVGGAERRSSGNILDDRVQLPTLDVASIKDVAPQCFNEKSEE